MFDLVRRSRALSARRSERAVDDGLLNYAGIIEVGSAPGERSLVMRSLERCATDWCPFARPPMLNDLVWVELALVVEVRSLASEAGRWLREPVFSRVVGLRALRISSA